MGEVAAHPSAVAPSHDPSRRSRLVKVGGWLVGIALVVIVLNLLGIDVVGWVQGAGLVFQSGQTLFAELSYYGILGAAFPGKVEFWPIVTATRSGWR